MVMTREKYIEKIEKHISDAKYGILLTDPTKEIIKKISKIAKPILKRSTIPNQYKTFSLLNNASYVRIAKNTYRWHTYKTNCFINWRTIRWNCLDMR